MDIGAGIDVGQERLFANAGINYGQNNKYGVGAKVGLSEDDLELGIGYNSNKEDVYFNLEGFENENKLEAKPKTVIIVLFHATWCGYCKRFMPEWNKFKENVNGKMFGGKQVNVREVESEEPIIKNYKIEGYPTVKAIDENGNETDFNGERNEEALNEFVNEVV